jgi:hypothetical protein
VSAWPFRAAQSIGVWLVAACCSALRWVRDWVVKRDGTDVRDGVILLIANNTALIEWLGPEPRASWEVMDTLTDS